MRERREDTFFDLLPTPDVGTRAVRLSVRQDRLRATSTITLGTTVQRFVADLLLNAGDVLAAGFGDYVLTAPGPADGAGYLAFIFGPASTSAKLKDLTPWSEKKVWQEYDWDDVLRYLYAVEGKQKDLAETGTSTTAGTPTSLQSERRKILTLDRYELVRGGRLPTEVIVRRYLTSQLITGIKAERPMAQPVRYAWNGLQNNIVCLHDDITIPEILTEASRLEGFGTANGIEQYEQGGQFFPRTNFLTWQQHIFRVEQADQPRDGLYETVTYEALPPPMPEGQVLAG